jgi:hypothetical protein
MINFLKANPFEVDSMAYKIDGYFIPNYTGNKTKEEEFERAKKELLGHLRRQLEIAEQMPFDIFIKQKSVSFSTKQYRNDAEQGVQVDGKAAT